MFQIKYCIIIKFITTFSFFLFLPLYFLHFYLSFKASLLYPLSDFADITIISASSLVCHCPSITFPQPTSVLLQTISLQSPELINFRLLHFIFQGIFGLGTEQVCSSAGETAITCSVLHSWWDPLSSVLQSSETHSVTHSVAPSTSRSWFGVRDFLHLWWLQASGICSALWLLMFRSHQDLLRTKMRGAAQQMSQSEQTICILNTILWLWSSQNWFRAWTIKVMHCEKVFLPRCIFSASSKAYPYI